MVGFGAFWSGEVGFGLLVEEGKSWVGVEG